MKAALLDSVRNQCLLVLQKVYLARFADEKMSKIVRQNKGGAFHLSTAGHELVGVVSALSLIPGKDWALPYYRDRAFALGLGVSLTEIMAEVMARDTEHHSSGRMMPEHFSQKELRIPCQSSCVGSQFLQAVGVAKGVQLKGLDEVVYVSAGDGATSQGDFHEALNFSCIHKLGVIFVIQDNGWAISVPTAEQTAGGSVAKMVSGYPGLSVFDVDGCNFEALSTALKAAVDRARAQEGPSVVVAKVPRMGPHSSSDDPGKYKSAQCVEKDQDKDPIPLYENWLLEMGLTTEEEMGEIQRRAAEEVERAAEKAEEIPFPDPSTVTRHLFKEFTLPSCSLSKREDNTMSDPSAIVMMDALNNALSEEMKRDPGVIVFGQDVAHGKGGVFGITKGLTAQFGKDRCFNTPLAESTIIGLCVGLSAVQGFKPVAEIQFADYLWTGINQLFNELASLSYRSNGEWHCPVVVRVPYGGYIQGGPYHSQSIEGFLSHCPGLKIVIPSNAADAKRLLKTAIRDPNPVIFLEHKALYRQRHFCARKEPSEHELLPFGKAHIVKEGTDVTVVAWGYMVVMAYDIAMQLEDEGISVEVIDLRTIVPYDRETVLESVKKTSKLLIIHEAAKNCGFGAEIAADVTENAFFFLDAPIMRLTGKDVPVPYSKVLEEEVLPQRKDVEKAIRSLASF